MDTQIFTFIYQFLGKIHRSFKVSKRTHNNAEAGSCLPDEKHIAETIAKVQNVRRLLEERGS